jgi:hypothetical protein
VDLLEEGGVCTEAAEKLLKKAEKHAIASVLKQKPQNNS